MASRADAFLESAVAQSLLADIGTAIISSLTGGLSANASCVNQVMHVPKLMDYIDENHPPCLQAVLDPTDCASIFLTFNKFFDVREFLKKYTDGGSIMDTLTALLQGCFTPLLAILILH